MKKILGLDLGTNSIGWALIEQDFEKKEGSILGMGSRIIPMSQDILGNFGKGNSISQTAERTEYRGVRRLRERHLLRRERLHRVLNILGFLPEHYASKIDFEKRLGQFLEGKEPKLAYNNEGFIFKKSFNEMLENFKKHQPGLLNRKNRKGEDTKVPYDWTLYFLRKKAMSQKIEKEELAWIILNFNQKRGYYQLRGKEKRSFRSPEENDWTLIKKKTEQDIDQSQKTVGTYIYEKLLENPKQKIKGKLVRTIERKFYKEELKSILEKQIELQPVLFPKKLYQDCIQELYQNNESQKLSLEKRDFVHLFLNDIIFYHRPLKSKKSSIGNCSLEYRVYKDEDGNNQKRYLKSIPKSNPYYQEFRVWQWLYNLKIYTKEDDTDVTEQFIKKIEDVEKLFEFLMSRKEVDHKAILKHLLNEAEMAKYRWNYVYDSEKDKSKEYPMNETGYEIREPLKNIESISSDFLTREIEQHLWHVIYSVTDKVEYEKSLKSFAKKYNLDEVSFVENFKNFKPFKSDYGRYSEKAIKKLLPLMRTGKYWNWDTIDGKTKTRINKIITGEYDEKIKDSVREKAINLTEKDHFQGLPLWLAEYIVYGETNTVEKWEGVDDLEKYLKEFKQHSLRNLIVEQVVMETLRVVKDIWKQYGNGEKDYFDEIHVELGRDMKNPAEVRKRMTKIISENESTNLRIKAILTELMNDDSVENARPYSPMQQEILKIYEDGVLNSGIDIPKEIAEISKKSEPTKSEIEKYKLWLEQKYSSPYTGQIIPLSKLFTADYEIEHIIPQSRYFDDSFSNKVICEAAVNKLKDNQLGLEFIKKHPGEKVPLGNGEIVEIFSEEDYKEFVKENYDKSRSKRNKLMLEKIPEKMIARQLNDTRYISKFVSKVLSNIVRSDKNDEGVNSKNLIPLNGKITARLKQDWGMNDVWNELILPRFERMNELTRKNDFTSWSTNLRIKAILTELMNDGSVENVRPYSPMKQEILKIYEDGVLNSGIKIPKEIAEISKKSEPTKSEIEKYKLWLEQKYSSPYTGQIIPLSKLFTADYEIEHIIPQSRYFDDSFSNKVICEAAVNKLKDNQLGLEFIKKHPGEKVPLGNGEIVEIFSEEDYKEFVKENYAKSRSKRNKLMLEEIPKKMIELTGKNDFTSWNEKHQKFLPTVPIELSKGFDKKRIDHRHHALDALIIACATRNHVNLLNNEHAKSDNKRFDLNKKLRKYEPKVYNDSKTGKRIERKVPTDFLKPWDNFTVDVKNELEKIVVTFKQNLRVINKATNKYQKWVDDENGKKKKELVEQEGTNWAIRKPIHKETFSGLVDLPREKEKLKKGEKLIASRKSLDTSFTLKNIDSITDTSIQKILKNYLSKLASSPEGIKGINKLISEYNKGKNSNQKLKELDSSSNLDKIKSDKKLLKYLLELAFSPEGIEDMNKDIAQYNNGKPHQPILKVRLFEKDTKRFQVGSKGNKSSKYVEAAKGTNLFFAIYQNSEKQKRTYETIPLNIVIERQKQGLPSVPQTNEKGDNLLFYLSPDDLVYVPTEEETKEQTKEERDKPGSVDFNNLTKEQIHRIYKFVSSSGKTGDFIPFTVSNLVFNMKKQKQKELNIDYDIQNEYGLGSPQSKNQKSIDDIMIKDFCWKLEINRLGKIKKIIK